MSNLRHDTKDLFRLCLLNGSLWKLTPCIVRENGEARVIRHPELLLHLPDDTEVLCPWPGKFSQDVFQFTVGDFRKAYEAQGNAEAAEGGDA